MELSTEKTIPVEFDLAGKRVATRAICYPSQTPRATLILGHGAGAPQSHPWLVALARALCERSIEAITFNFLYTEAKRRMPDKGDVLEATWRAVIESVLPSRETRPLFIGGKSMGGRIATQVLANPIGAVARVRGGVLLGYPLHPPDKPEQLRVKHLPAVRAPLLFIQGEKDEFGTPDELRPFLKGLPEKTRLVVFEGGDHSLKSPKKIGVSFEQTLARAADEIAAFIASFDP